jgi:hypothetical protein
MDRQTFHSINFIRHLLRSFPHKLVAPHRRLRPRVHDVESAVHLSSLHVLSVRQSRELSHQLLVLVAALCKGGDYKYEGAW